MLTPNQLQALPDSLVALYEQLESEIIADMARRITKAEYLTDTTTWQSFKAQELKATRAEIIRKLSRTTGKSEQELKKMFEDAGAAALAYDDDIYKATGLSPVPLARSKALQAALAAGLKNTKGELRNLTRTTANTASKQFEDALDAAYMRVMSGAFSPQDAIRRAVKALAAEGLQSIRYPSGHTDKIDVAIRRADRRESNRGRPAGNTRRRDGLRSGADDLAHGRPARACSVARANIQPQRQAPQVSEFCVRHWIRHRAGTVRLELCSQLLPFF